MKNFFIPTKENNYKPFLLRKLSLFVYTVLLLFVNTFGGFLGIPEAMASSITPSNIIQLTNQERAAAGLNTLSTNSKLAAAALAKANNMFEEQYWDHYGPNGETPWMFISAAGYAYVYAGENLAKGFSTAEGVHEAWMASPTHRENIMGVSYKDIGVAVVQGELLGKDTILVVQMFGNLTSQKFVPTPDPSPESAPTQDTPIPAKPLIPEQGEIKSIRIISPKAGDLTNDANINVKGETENISGSYTVEVLDQGNLVGETVSNSQTWEFDKVSDWEEGDKEIQAKIKGENIKSEEVHFTVDSTPPVILQETVKVKRGKESFELSFAFPKDSVQLTFVTGDKTYNIEVVNENTVTITIQKADIGEKSLIIAADDAGNISELDISEYFFEEVKGEDRISPIVLGLRNIFGTTDGISILIVSFIFVLLTVLVFVSWKQGKLGRNIGELFTIGAWWLIILVGIFKGFGGVIS